MTLKPLQFTNHDQTLITRLKEIGCSFSIDGDKTKLRFEETLAAWQLLDDSEEHDMYADIGLSHFCDLDFDLSQILPLYHQAYFINIAQYDPDIGLTYQLWESLEENYHRCNIDVISDHLLLFHDPLLEQENIKNKIKVTQRVLNQLSDTLQDLLNI